MYQSLLLLFVAIAMAVLCYRWKRRRLYELLSKWPGPEGIPFIGNSCGFRGTDSEIASYLLKISQEYSGGLYRLWLGPVAFCFLTKPEYIEIFLNSPLAFDKSQVYNFTRFLLGDSIGTSKSDVWRKNRKILAPSFSSIVLNQYPEKIVEQCEVFLDILSRTNGKMIPICQPITNFSVDAFFVTNAGVAESDFQRTNSNVDKLLEEQTRIMFMRIVKIWYHLECIFQRSKQYKKQMEICKKLWDMSDRYFYQRKNELSMEERTLPAEKRIYKPLPDDILLKNPKCYMSEEHLLSEFRTFFIAGTDTNANTLSFVLTALGIYKGIQQKVYEEVLEVVGPHRAVQLVDLSKLQYVERVIKETLRLIPALPNIGRRTSEEIDLGDYVIPRAVEVFVSIYSVQRDPQYWPNPTKFDPDRFLPENSKNRHPYTWLPFSGGPRNCIGLKYAMMIMKIFVAMVIRRFIVHSKYKDLNDIELTINIVTKSREPLELSFTKRE